MGLGLTESSKNGFPISLLLSVVLKGLKLQKFSGGFAPWTPTGALPLDPTGGWRPQTPANFAPRRASHAAIVSHHKPASLRSASCTPQDESLATALLPVPRLFDFDTMHNGIFQQLIKPIKRLIRFDVSSQAYEK